MKIKIFCLILLFFALGISTYPQSITEATIDIIHSEFGKEVKTESSKYIIPGKLKNEIEKTAGQHFYSDAVYIFKVTKKDSIISVGILDNVYGKSLPITFLVLYKLNGDILSTYFIILMLQIKKRKDGKSKIRFMLTICFYQDTRHEKPLYWIQNIFFPILL